MILVFLAPLINMNVIIYLFFIAIALTIIFTVIFFIIIISNLLFLFITGVPYVSSGKETCSKVFEKVSINHLTNIYDLGCGNGQFLFEAAKFNPAKCVGYELSLIPFFVALVKSIFQGSDKVKVYWKNFLQAEIGDADLVYIYLVKRAMPKLAIKLKNDLRPGTIIISKGSLLPGWRTIDRIILDEKSGYGLNIYKV